VPDIIDELESKNPDDPKYYSLKNNYDIVFQSIIEYKGEEKSVGWYSKRTTSQILDYLGTDIEPGNISLVSTGMKTLNEAGLLPKWKDNDPPKWDFSQIDDDDLNDIEEAYDEVRQYFEEET
jgi:hypothetical protein